MNRRSLVGLLAAVACAHSRPVLEREPLVKAPVLNLRAFAMRVGNETVPFVLSSEGGPPMVPLAAARRARFYLRDHSKLGHSARTRIYYIDYDGSVHADIVAYGATILFPSGIAAKFDLQAIPEHGDVTPIGFLSLQDLVNPGDAIVIDFPKEEIRVDREAPALATFKETHPDAQRLDFETCDAARSVEVELYGTKTRMTIATGASATFLLRNSPVATALHERRGRLLRADTTRGTLPAYDLGELPLHMAGAAFKARAVVVPTTSEACPKVEGELGMDILQHCAFAWADRELWLSCHPPALRGTL